MAQADFLINTPAVSREALPEAGMPVGLVASPGAELQAAGHAGLRAVDYYNRDMYRLAHYKGEQTLQDFQASEAQRLDTELRSAPPGAPNFTQGFMAKHAELASDALTKVDPTVAPLMQAQFNGFKDQLALKSFFGEQQARDQYYLDTTKTSLDNFTSTITSDPSTFTDKLQQGLDTINSTGLPNDKKAQMSDAWKTQAAVGLYNNEVINDPDGLRLKLGGASKINDPRRLSILNSTRNEATTQGVNPDTAAATIYLENGKMIPDLVHKGGFAVGLFGLDQAHRDQYGYKPGDINSDIHAGVASVGEREASARKFLGRDPQPWETYLFHYQGEGGAAALLKANPNDSVSDVLTAAQGPKYAAAALTSNPDMRTSVGQFLQGIQVRMNNALNATNGKFDPNLPTAAPEYASVPYTENIRMSDAANRAYNQQMTDAYKADTDYGKQMQDYALKDIYDAHTSGELTTKQVQSYRNVLDASHYAGALALADKTEEGSDTKTNFGVWAHLKTMAQDPQQAPQVRDLAVQAVGGRYLNRGDYDKLDTIAQKTINDNQPGLDGTDKTQAYASVQKLMRDKVVSNKMDVAGKEAYDRANMALQDYKFNNPKASYKDIQDAAGRITEQYLANKPVQDALAALHISDAKQATPQAIEQLKAKLLDGLQSTTVNNSDKFKVKQMLKQLQDVETRAGIVPTKSSTTVANPLTQPAAQPAAPTPSNNVFPGEDAHHIQDLFIQFGQWMSKQVEEQRKGGAKFGGNKFGGATFGGNKFGVSANQDNK